MLTRAQWRRLQELTEQYWNHVLTNIQLTNLNVARRCVGFDDNVHVVTYVQENNPSALLLADLPSPSPTAAANIQVQEDDAQSDAAPQSEASATTTHEHSDQDAAGEEVEIANDSSFEEKDSHDDDAAAEESENDDDSVDDSYDSDSTFEPEEEE